MMQGDGTRRDGMVSQQEESRAQVNEDRARLCYAREMRCDVMRCDAMRCGVMLEALVAE